MKSLEIDLWSLLGKVAGIGAFALLAYRTIYPAPQPATPSPLPIVPAIPVRLQEPDSPHPDDQMDWDFVRPDQTSATPTREPLPTSEPTSLPEENGVMMTNVLVGQGSDKSLLEAGVPQDIASTVLANVDGSENRAFLTALCWQETRYNNKAIRAKSGDDGGHSKGPWQVHDRWAKVTAAHARRTGNTTDADVIMAGISEDLSLNLAGVRALIRVQKPWRGDGGFHDIASYYNEGSSWRETKGQLYADSVMDKYSELLPIFQAQY
jgi:hypothetical protein